MQKADPKQTHIATQWKHTSPLISCRFDPTGTFVFATAEDNTIQRWALGSGTKVSLAAHDSWVRAMTFAADGKVMVTGGCDDQLIWWPVGDDAPKPSHKVLAHRGWIRSLATSPDQKLIASGGNDNILKLWNAESGALVREMPGHEKNIYSVTFHPSGEFVLSGDLKGQVKQWEVKTGKEVRTIDAKELHTYNGGQRVDYGGIRSIDFSPDLKYVALSGLHKATNPLGAVNEPIVQLFEWESQKLIRSHVSEGVKGVAWRVRFHRDGYMVCGSGGSGGGFLLFWDPDKEKNTFKFKLPNTARDMDLHSDGLQVASAHHDMHLRICRMAPKS